jgi:hypothetical protein
VEEDPSENQLLSFMNLQHAKGKVMFSKLEVQCKPEILNASVKHVNTKTGISVNISLDFNQELDNIAVL